MKKTFTLIAACTLLTACGDPLSKVDKLSSVELAPDTETVAALADPAQQVRTGGLFSNLFNRGATPKPSTAAIAQTDSAVSEALGLETPMVASAAANESLTEVAAAVVWMANSSGGKL